MSGFLRHDLPITAERIPKNRENTLIQVKCGPSAMRFPQFPFPWDSPNIAADSKVIGELSVNMEIRNKVAFLFLTMIAVNAPAINPALAHGFNVALVIAQSSAASVAARQVRQGFMLATTERDGHPDQESDGHLGGLDVYVSVIDGTEDVGAAIGRIAARGEVDIIAVFGSETALSPIRKLVDGSKIVLLLPGQSPFAETDRPAVASFISAYQREYGGTPSAKAAEGYNAARRIDAAVRAQGGVDDRASLLRIFRETARRFAW